MTNMDHVTKVTSAAAGCVPGNFTSLSSAQNGGFAKSGTGGPNQNAPAVLFSSENSAFKKSSPRVFVANGVSCNGGSVINRTAVYSGNNTPRIFGSTTTNASDL